MKFHLFVAILLAALVGCDSGAKHPRSVKSVAGRWKISGAAKGEMDFNAGGVLAAGPVGHTWNVGTWSQESDEVTLLTNGSSKNARVEWHSDDDLDIVPLDAKGEGPHLHLTRVP